MGFGWFVCSCNASCQRGTKPDLNADCMHSQQSRAIQRSDAKCPFTAPSAQHRGPCGHGGPHRLLGPRQRGFWALEDVQICHMDLGSCFAKEISLQVGPASSVRSLLVPCPPVAPACPGTASQVMGTSSFSSLQSTENYPAKGNTDDFYFTVSVKAWLKGRAGKTSGGNKTRLLR